MSSVDLILMRWSSRSKADHQLNRVTCMESNLDERLTGNLLSHSSTQVRCLRASETSNLLPKRASISILQAKLSVRLRVSSVYSRNQNDTQWCSISGSYSRSLMVRLHKEAASLPRGLKRLSISWSQPLSLDRQLERRMPSLLPSSKNFPFPTKSHAKANDF